MCTHLPASRSGADEVSSPPDASCVRKPASRSGAGEVSSPPAVFCGSVGVIITMVIIQEPTKAQAEHDPRGQTLPSRLTLNAEQSEDSGMAEFVADTRG